ncbi:MAG TPA: hypothetical protein VK501_16245, partial [Baekduia sp.]
MSRIARRVALTSSSNCWLSTTHRIKCCINVLGHSAVDVVVAHLVADPVRRPAERELREVAGAEHDAAALVGDPEQVVGAQAGLDVLEGDVVDRLALGEGMAELLEHQPGGGPDVELLPRDAERAHQRDRVVLGVLAGREAGQGEAEDVGARQSERIESARRDQQRVGRIQAAGDADHDALAVGHLQALGEAL